MRNWGNEKLGKWWNGSGREGVVVEKIFLSLCLQWGRGIWYNIKRNEKRNFREAFAFDGRRA